jgi:hypothetical protein
MADKAQPGEHLASARKLLTSLEREMDLPSGDSQVRATAAVAHSVLALAEQVSKLGIELRKG